MTKLLIGFILGICASAAIAQSVPIYSGGRAVYAAGKGPDGLLTGISLDAKGQVLARCDLEP